VLKVSEYLNHAQECEAMAKAATMPAHVEALLKMAATWRELATARSQQIERWGEQADGAELPAEVKGTLSL
jgi:hypothetical protein